MALHYYLVVAYSPDLPKGKGRVLQSFTYSQVVGGVLPKDSVRVTLSEYLAHPAGSLWTPRVPPLWPIDEEVLPTPTEDPEREVLPLAGNGVRGISVSPEGSLVIQREDGSLVGTSLPLQAITSASINPDGTLTLYSGSRRVDALGNTQGIGGFEAKDGLLVITRVDTSKLTVDPTGAKITTVKNVPVSAGSTVFVDTVPSDANRSVKYHVLVEDRDNEARLSMELLVSNQFGNSVDYAVYARVGNTGAQIRVAGVLDAGTVKLEVTNNEATTQYVSFTRSSL